jgi:hypothetical protein
LQSVSKAALYFLELCLDRGIQFAKRCVKDEPAGLKKAIGSNFDCRHTTVSLERGSHCGHRCGKDSNLSYFAILQPLESGIHNAPQRLWIGRNLTMQNTPGDSKRQFNQLVLSIISHFLLYLRNFMNGASQPVKRVLHLSSRLLTPLSQALLETILAGPI